MYFVNVHFPGPKSLWHGTAHADELIGKFESPWLWLAKIKMHSLFHGFTLTNVCISITTDAGEMLASKQIIAQ